jgi:hypothetical protein
MEVERLLFTLSRALCASLERPIYTLNRRFLRIHDDAEGVTYLALPADIVDNLDHQSLVRI